MQTTANSPTVWVRHIVKSKLARLAAIILAGMAPLLVSAQDGDTLLVPDPSFENCTYNSVGAGYTPLVGWAESTQTMGVAPANTWYWNNGGDVDQTYVAFMVNDGIAGFGTFPTNGSFQVGQVYWVQCFVNAMINTDTPVFGIYEGASVNTTGGYLNVGPIVPVGNTGPAGLPAPFYFVNIPFVANAANGNFYIAKSSLSGTDHGAAILLWDGVSTIRRSANDVVIRNPSFEASGTGETPPGYINTNANLNIAGWTISGGLAGVNQTGGPLADNGTIPDGINVLALSSGAGASQSLYNTNGRYLYIGNGLYTNNVATGSGLVAGENYQLSLYLNAELGAAANPTAVVQIDAYTAYSNTVTAVGGSNPYNLVTYTFQALAPSATLIISNATPANTASTLLVDNVRLVLLPDSITVADPSFELGNNTNSPYYGLPPDWTWTPNTPGAPGVGGGDVGGPYWDNGQNVDQGNVGFIQNDGTISQSLTGFQVGQTYWIQCFVNAGASPTWTDTPVLSIACTASTAGASPLTNNIIVTAVGATGTAGTGNPFTFINVPFTAAATSGTLSFSKVSLSGTDSGNAVLLIDGISVIRRASNEVVIANPSFEASGTGYTYPGYESPIAGWAMSGTGSAGYEIINQLNAITRQPFFDNGVVPDGLNVFGIQTIGANTVGITQTLQGLVPGNPYRLTLYLSDRSSDAPYAAALVQIDGQTAFSGPVYPSGAPGSPYPFSQYVDYTFTADDTNVVLSITNTAQNGMTLLVDDVDLYSISNSTIAVTSSGNNVPYGTPVTFTATVTGSGGTPGGAVNFYDGTNFLGTGTLLNGVATLTTTSLPVGSSQTITAVYAGNINFNGGTTTLPGGQTVNVAPLAVVIGGSHIYNGTVNISPTNLTIANSISGTNLTLSGTAALASKDVGSETIAATGSATPTFVQKATGSILNGAYTPANFSKAPADGNTLIAVISTRGTATNQITSITEAGAVWSRVVQSAVAGSNPYSTSEIWYAPNVKGAGTGVTITPASGSVNCAAIVMEYSGVLAAGAVDQRATSTGNSSSAVTGTTPTTTQASELWIGGIGLVNSTYTLTTPLNSFSVVASAASTGGTAANQSLAYALARVVTATASASSGGTVSASSVWSGAIATFVGGADLQLNGSAATNYTLTGMTGSVTVTPKAVNMGGLTAPARAYDGTVTATVSGSPGTLTGSESPGGGSTSDGLWYTGDAVSLTGTATGTYNSPLVGIGNLVTFTGVSLAGAQASDYTLTLQSPVSSSITPLTLTLSGSGTYNGTATMSSENLTIGNIYSGDAGNIALSGTAVLAGATVGSQAIAPYATPAIVQSATGNTGSSAANAIYVTLPSAPVNGDTLVAVVSTRGTTSAEVGDFYQPGALWSGVTGAVNGSVTTEIWYAPNVSGAGTSVEIDLNASLFATAVVREYSGLLTANLVDQTAINTGTGTAADTGTTPGTTQAGELWFGGIGLANSGYALGTPNNSFTSVASAVSTGSSSSQNSLVYALEKIVSASGTADSGGTVSGTAAIAQRGSATTANNSGNTVTITKPTGVVLGDVMIACIAQYNSSGTPAAASLSGWTVIKSGTLGGSSSRYGTILYKVAGSSEASSYAFALTATVGGAVGDMVAFSGVDNTTPVDAVASGFTSSTGSAAAASAATINTASANALAILFEMAATTTSSTGGTWSSWASGLSALFSQAGSGSTSSATSVGAASKTIASPGATGAGSVTLSKNMYNAGIWVALKPASQQWVGAIATFRAKTVGSLTLSGSAAPNYTTVAASGSVTIGAKTLTMSGLSVPSSKVYDGSAMAAVSGSPGSLQTAETAGSGTTSDGAPYIGDAVSLTGTAIGTYNSPTVALASTVTYGGVSLAGVQAYNYSLTIESPASATITSRPVTLAGARTYDGTAIAASSILMVSDAVGGDDVNVTGSAALAGAGAGLQAITDLSGLTLGGLTAGNYTMSGAGGSVTIGPVVLSITANPVTKTYGTAMILDPTAFSVGSGLVSPETVTAVTMSDNGGAAATAPVSGSPYTITPSAATGTGGFVARNYNIAYNTGTLTVAPLTTILTEQYDGTTNTASPGLVISNVVGSDDVQVTGSGGMASADIGTNEITSVGTLALGGVTAPNYTLGTNVIVTPLPVTLTGSRPYDGTASADESILTIVTNYDGANLTLTGSATLAGSGAGAESITDFAGLTLDGTAATNYSLTGASGSVTITTVALSITANPVTKTYGTAVTLDPTAFSVGSGLVSPETVTAVTMSDNGGAAATAPVSGSPYVITPSAATGAGGFAAGNYDITYITNALTVNPLAVTLAGSRAYDGTPIAAATILTVTDAVGGDDVKAASGSATLGAASVGVQPITDATGLILGGMTAGNYTSSGASGSVVISNSWAQYAITSQTLVGSDLGTGLQVCWQSVPGVVYNVLTNANPGQATGWVDVGGAISPVTATGTTTCVTIPGVRSLPLTNTFVVIKQN